MTGPDWFRWILTAAFLAVAAYCVARLAAARKAPERYHGCHRAVDVAHGVMSVGMAGMCSPIGGPVPVAGWQTMFLLIAVWFFASWWQQRRSGAAAEPIGWHGSGLHHAVAGVAMLYMLTAMPHDALHMSAPWMPGSHGPAGLALPVIGWLFAAYFVAHATLLGRMTVRTAAAGDAQVPGILLAPRLTASCQVFMALGASYMLVAM